MPYYPVRRLTIIALDPSVKAGPSVLRTRIEIPNELLSPGPRGHRIHIIDYDSTTGTFNSPAPIPAGVNRDTAAPDDPFEKASDSALVDDPAFHSFMTYGIVMKTLARFEFALGRRVKWGFSGHQIQIAPHAFADANAFYADRAHGLFFGYFPSANGKRTIFSCLSHEVVAHETSHALLDGLRERYTDPSSAQQAGFHEGFADIVALLSILSAQEVVERVVDLGRPDIEKTTLLRRDVSPKALRKSTLFALAEEMGSELTGIHGNALRRSISLAPGPDYLKEPGYNEAHNCGEILVAAVLNAYLEVWMNRLKAIGDEWKLDRRRAAEEGAEIASRLLTMCIRAIDYCPPTDLQFCDFVSAVLTADWELNPKDEKYRIRRSLLKWFRQFHIEPSSRGTAGREPGSWDPPPDIPAFSFDRTHYEQMKWDPDELFRFIWENRAALKLHEQAFTRILSVRPCLRTAPDGFVLRETVVEYHQQLSLRARELAALKIRKPNAMPDTQPVTLYGGNALVFDEYGRVKYNIGNSIFDADMQHTQERQSKRLEYLWEHGAFRAGASKLRALARMHRLRATQWYRSAPGANGYEV